MTRRSTTARACATIVACLIATGLAAQPLPVPDGWKWVTDAPATHVATRDPRPGTWLFATMAPGWHITTRPGVLLFEPSHTARGRFVLESETFLFPDSGESGFGLFVGGADLDGSPRYVAFLVRGDGSAAVEATAAGRTRALTAWSKAASITPIVKGGSPVGNTLRIEAEASALSFKVNGEAVAEIPRDAAPIDGIVGLRIGPDLNLHVSSLDLTHRLALPRAKTPPAP